MVIGLIGPRVSCEKIRRDMEVIAPEIETRLYIREVSAQAIEVIEECEQECDATLFTGGGLYYSVTRYYGDVYKLQKPCDYINKSSVSLLKVFLEMTKEGLELDYFSIDVAEPGIIEDTFADMEIVPENFYSLPFESCDENVYIDWHMKLWKQKKTKVMITSFVGVYDYLKKEGYPAFYLSPSRSMVRISLDRLKNRFAIHEASYSQLAVEILRISENMAASENYYYSMLKKNEVEGHIINYAQEIQGSFFSYGRHEYIIFASKGCVAKEENYVLLYNLQENIHQQGFQLNAGIGIGTTAYQSENNARKSLIHAMTTKENSIFMVDENDLLIGPLGHEKKLEYELISSDSRIIEISSKAEISPSSVTKLMSIIEMRKDAVFDAGQLADCLHVSSRSARRVMNKLIQNGYASVCGRESASGGGRPKNLVEIHF